LNAGQQQTANLSWLVKPGSIQSALVTGVLGIPADPRLIEVIGWLAYLIPVALFLNWPPSRRPHPRTAVRLQLTSAAAFAALALGLIVLYPSEHPRVPAQAILVVATEATPRAVGTAQLSAPSDGSSPVLTVSLEGSADTALRLTNNRCRPERHDGVEASACVITRSSTPVSSPSRLTFDQIVGLSAGRVPVGLNPAQHPGPFTAKWSIIQSTDVWTADGILLDAAGRSTTIVTLSGGGLQTPRTLRVKGNAAAASGWQVSVEYRNQAVRALKSAAAERTERTFWAIQVPAMLAIGALLLIAFAGFSIGRARHGSESEPANSNQKVYRRADDTTAKGSTYAAR
jgi:high-affinity iron transporter